MNRKQRRATAASRPPVDGSTRQYLEQAFLAEESGDDVSAARLYRKLLALDPDDAAASHNLAFLLLRQNKRDQAAGQFIRLAQIAPQCLDDFDEVGRALRTLSPALDTLAGEADAAWPRRLDADNLLTRIAPIVSEPFLHTVLAEGLIYAVDFERLLVSVRRAILHAVVAETAVVGEASGLVDFCAALAQQCFNNEYLYPRTAEESAELAELRGRLAGHLDPASATLPLLVFAMYEPLHTLPGAESLLDWRRPRPLLGVIARQIAEPLKERELRGSIPVLTGIEDGRTQAVRAQYEENPYPRWIRLSAPPAPVALDDHVRQLFPTTPVSSRRSAGQTDILVAGCGTGRHALQVAQFYRGARVLAVDISRASLAFAKRMTPAELEPTIDWAQADILSIGTIGRDFDLVYAGGVLHHLYDPFAGWRELVALMRTGGLMQVGLYSEVARADVVTARQLIADKGYRAEPDDIRQSRDDVVNSPAMRNLMRSRDFYSLSGCRDLLFHVQEHRFTIPQIKSFIDESGLQFLGFEFSPYQAHAYHRDAFAQRGWSPTDLDRWDAYETAHPATFAGMYNFWLQKP